MVIMVFFRKCLFNSPAGEPLFRLHQIAKIITPKMRRTPAAAAPAMTVVSIPLVLGCALGFEPMIYIKYSTVR